MCSRLKVPGHRLGGSYVLVTLILFGSTRTGLGKVDTDCCKSGGFLEKVASMPPGLYKLGNLLGWQHLSSIGDSEPGDPAGSHPLLLMVYVPYPPIPISIP